MVQSVVVTVFPVVFLAILFGSGARLRSRNIRIVLAEEQHLQKAFGREYADYCRRVRRYL